MPRRVRVLVVSLLTVASVWILPAAVGAAGETYVALGDSYTSGPFIPAYEEPWGCLRSTNNYPHLIARELGYELRDASCAGAETDDMTQTQGVTPGPNPPQFDRLDASVDLVTLQIGGNDIGFGSIAEDCFSPTPVGATPCQDRYVVDGVDEISVRIAETAPKVAAVLQGIHERSPDARVLVVGYIAIFPETLVELCWPQLPVAYEDMHYLRAKQYELNAMLAEQSAANGAEYVDAYAASIGHDACQPPGLKWTEALAPTSPAAPVHPNLLGMLGMAESVKAALAAAPAA
jgi:lysophospholipase L1-like esterase